MLKSLALFLIVSLCAGCAQTPLKQANTPANFDVMELTIDQAQAAIRSDVIRCEQLVGRYLKRIEAYDKTTGLNAIIYVNRTALQRARQLDRAFAKTGSMRKLHCVPTILKDRFDAADMPTEAGSVALQGAHSPDDAFMVRRLREEDAIIIAKSNMDEWAFSPYHTISSTHGETRNAFDLTRVPAGSSGGTASGIAANFGIVGMGTDTGNSIRGPALR